MDQQLEARSRKALLAFAEGQAATYMAAYQEVMQQLERDRATSLLLSVVNTLLARMAKDQQSVFAAGKAMLQELSSPRSAQFVLAAVAEVVLNERKAGDKLTALPTLEETMRRWA